MNTVATAVQSHLRRTLPPSLRVAGGAVADAAPYLNLQGTCVTVTFNHNPVHLPFQKDPFNHPSVPGLYHQVLFDTYMAQIHMPSLNNRTSSTAVYGDHNAEETLAKLGPLTTRYSSITDKGIHRMKHPAYGNVELTRDQHRRGYGLKMSLWDENKRPLSMVVLTGPRGDGDRVRPVKAESAGSSHDSRRRLQEEEEQEADRVQEALVLAKDDGGINRVPFQLFGEGPQLRVVGGTKNYFQKGFFFESACPTKIERTPEDMEILGPEAMKAAEMDESPEVLPWCIEHLAGTFAHGIAKLIDGFPLSIPPKLDAGKNPFARWTKGGRAAVANQEQMQQAAESLESDQGLNRFHLIAHNSVVADGVIPNTPFEIVCAEPKVFPSHHTKPWERSAGLPYTSGEPCLALRMEIWQRGVVCAGGTFFFIPPVRFPKG